MRQICLDTETTGTKAEEGDRIVEIGCFEIVGRTLSDDPSHVYWQYINPERDVPADAVAIHGLTNEFLADKPVFADIADDFLKFVEGAELVIHNAAFDVGFLNMELARIGKGKIEDYCPSIVDSLAIARQKYPGVRNSLDALCTRFEVDSSMRTLHGACLDARLLGEVYLAMTRSQDDLVEILNAMNRPKIVMPDNNPDDIGVGLVHGDSANVDYFDGHAAGRSRPELRAAPMLNFQYFVDSAGNTIIM